MSSDTPAPKSALIPTTLPLPPQNIHPDELKVILAEAAARHAEAEEALAAAQDHFDAANRAHEYALSEEQKRLEREEQATIEKMRALYPAIIDDADRFRRRFLEQCNEENIFVALPSIFESFAYWSRYRALALRLKQRILLYDSTRSRDAWELWLRRIYGWGELIRSVTSEHIGGGALVGEDDADGLAAVNLQINEESKSAPHPLHRDAADKSTPHIEDLGLRDPALASIDMVLIGQDDPLEFSAEFSNALQGAAISWAARTTDLIAERAREEFTAAAEAGAAAADA
jgi:hypothetical protein